MELYNTLSRHKEPFTPLHDKRVGMYSCGPTVYTNAHIGNLRAYIFADILRRVLEMNEYQVTTIMNITDVGHLTSDEDTGEDKIEQGAKREHLSAWDLADKYFQAFKQDCEKLNIIPPKQWVKATDHIDDQVAMIKTLEEKGFTYKIDDGIYFDTSKLAHYGRLGNIDLSKQQTSDRELVQADKKQAADFALWKFAYPKGRSFDSAQDDAAQRRQMEWDSPWGKGFPGWHIECSAMSTKYLGDEFDIHTGGVDHISVHHNNEIAQSEAAMGKIPAKFWLHSEFLTIDNAKMAKSEENFCTLDDLEAKGFEPMDFRYLVLMAHYRSKMNFTWDGLVGAKNALAKIRALNKNESKKPNTEEINKAKAALNDDLDTPQVLAILHQANNYWLWKAFENVLALDIDKPINNVEIPEKISKLAQEREMARTKQDWVLADKIRAEIESSGYRVEDTSKGSKILPK